MLKQQIEALQIKEDDLGTKIAQHEENIRKYRIELSLIKKAKQSLEKLEGQISESTDIS